MSEVNDESRHDAVKALHDILQSVPCSSLYSLAEAALEAGYHITSEGRQPVLDTGPGSTLKVMRGPGGGLYLSGAEDLREGDVFVREARK